MGIEIAGSRFQDLMGRKIYETSPTYFADLAEALTSELQSLYVLENIAKIKQLDAAVMYTVTQINLYLLEIMKIQSSYRDRIGLVTYYQMIVEQLCMIHNNATEIIIALSSKN